MSAWLEQHRHSIIIITLVLLHASSGIAAGLWHTRKLRHAPGYDLGNDEGFVVCVLVVLNTLAGSASFTALFLYLLLQRLSLPAGESDARE